MSTSSSSPGESTPEREWWRRAVIYQVYPRSFADSDGDGMGDLPGVTAKLPYLRDLGVDGVWLSPFYRSPQADAGYDVADYRDVDPMFGSLADAEQLIATASGLGLRVIVDLVPNHTSDEHVWFQDALDAPPGSPQRDRYMFRDGRGRRGAERPNNWRSVFGGPAWTRVTEADGTPGQWYLHLFDAKQPDLNWANPEVREEFHDILRFWLDRGVAGFRVDVAHGLVKSERLPDWDLSMELLGASEGAERPPMWDQDGVHEIYRGWRKVLDTYPGERMLVAEAWVDPPQRLANYVRGDEMHQAFNFSFLVAPWAAQAQRAAIGASLAAGEAVGAPSTWVLSNHDVVRHATRLALTHDPEGPPTPAGLTADDAQPDQALGLRRARAATMLMLALPGSAYLYQGEELGLPDHTTLPHEHRQDPAFLRTNGAQVGRDGCRAPMPWATDGPGYGFGPGGTTWLPQPDSYRALAADRQVGVPGSTLELYRTLLRLRRSLDLGCGKVAFEDPVGVGLMAADAQDVLVFRNGAVVVVVNFSAEDLALPTGMDVLVASEPDGENRRRVDPDGAVWLRAR